ncbi:MAG: hypothetical protein HRU15_03635 [Planctomycetes bacterium]|nr:hypothetical protein [Planctomycetota bacterium]
MITCRDFVPLELKPGRFFTPAEMEDFSECMQRVNEWVSANAVDVINIETVVLPNIHAAHEEGSTDVDLRTSGDFQTMWHQFIRIWYYN